MVRTLEILLPPWLERRTGHFIGLSSMADTLLNPGAPSYSASKAGFSNYFLGMALRLRSHGIAESPRARRVFPSGDGGERLPYRGS